MRGMIRSGRSMSEGTKLLLLAMPFLLFVLAFCYVPLLGWVYAFFDYKPGISIMDSKFIGLKVFRDILDNPSDLLRVLRNTLTLSLMGIITSPLAMVFAIMLNEIRSKRLRKLVQTTATLPNFISWIVVFALCFAIFTEDGMFNNLIRLMGGTPPATNILGNNDAAWFFQWGIATWKTLGWNAIIYMAAISGIDSELYDAAHVDGANRFQTIMNVTVPGLYSTYFVLLLLAISNMLSNGFDQYFVFYNPLTADKLEVLDYYVFKVGVLTNNYPMSIALGMCKTIVSITLLFTANTISKRLRGTSIV